MTRGVVAVALALLSVAVALALLFVAVALASPVPTASTAAPQPPPASESLLVAMGAVTYVRDGGSGGGTTVFHFDDSYTYSYTYTYRRAGDSLSYTFLPHVSATVVLRHDVHLPREGSDSLAWFQRLRRHELDHVALSTDERPALLFRWLVAHVPPLSRTAVAGAAAGDVAGSAIKEAVDERHAAVVRLIQRAYDRLDADTKHGVVGITDRDVYFGRFYSRSDLVDAEFPWAAEVESLAVSPRYVHALRGRWDAGR